MAIAKTEIICKECGKAFIHSKECRNRREADSYESWATTHIDTCPECYRKQRAERNVSALQAKLDELGIALPAIKGASDKQVAYAMSVRERYLGQHLDRIDGYHKVQQILNNEEQVANFARLCNENGMTVEEGIRQNIEYMGLTTVQLMLTSTSAKEILDSKM